MIFTDDDLKRWKESFEEIGLQHCLGKEEAMALLARLQAAENVVKLGWHTGTCLQEIGQPCDCPYGPVYETWRKMAGK